MTNPNSRISDPSEFVSNPGERFRDIYTPYVCDDGTIVLKVVDKEDIRAKINSERELTDIACIVKRLQLGDTSALNPYEPMYGDFTKLPKTMAEALNLSINAEKAFEHLPKETRAQFEYSYSKWLASAGSADWLDKMNAIKAIVSENNTEVSTDEQKQ